MIISLTGTWTLQQEGSDLRIPAQVPGCVHRDLLAAAIIDDPFVGTNESRLRWILEQGWTYRRAFDVGADLLTHSRVLLYCEGLDTVTHLRLNGTLLGMADNMFRRWEFDVKPLLHAGNNEIEIHFESPIHAIQARQKAMPVNYPSPPHQVPFFSQIRKAAYSFGWDWGPCLPTSGIWRAISLRGLGAERLRNVCVRQDHTQPDGSVRLDVDIEAEGAPLNELQARASLALDGCEVGRATAELSTTNTAGSVSLLIENPRLWWPRGLGEQPLYLLTVELVDKSGRVVDQWKRRLGLRTLTLDLSPDQFGNTFSFRANGLPFFAKGTNWIPADSFLPRVTPEKYRHLLTAAAEAHMNMIRVWGGGIYESDVFYDLCDELGLCVWQDFMFACASYPLTNTAFVENALIEATEQIQRLRHHACMALWCGNNELEMCGYVFPQAAEGQMSLHDYREFFEKRLPGLLAALAPEQSYWPGSPYKEAGKFYHPDVWVDNPGYGDTHNWLVWHLKKPFEFYRECQHRFISEFGFQSYPEPSTIARFADANDHHIHSPVMLHHQRCAGGNDRIADYHRAWLRPPRDFETLLWCSQILQGLAMKIACEHWRRSMPRTMGTLIWQLNDAWPAASWAGIDSFGQWKAMHYMARRFYAPLLISATVDVGKVGVYTTSDLRERVTCTWSWKLTDLQGKELQRSAASASLPHQESQRLGELDFRDMISRHGEENLLLWLSLQQGSLEVSTDVVLFTKPKNLDLFDPELSWTQSNTTPDSTTMTLRAKKPALWVWVEAPGTAIHASDNFFHLEPGVPVTIQVRTSVVTPHFSSLLRARSLFDTY